jgi:hypothetical protein
LKFFRNILKEEESLSFTGMKRWGISKLTRVISNHVQQQWTAEGSQYQNRIQLSRNQVQWDPQALICSNPTYQLTVNVQIILWDLFLWHWEKQYWQVKPVHPDEVCMKLQANLHNILKITWEWVQSCNLMDAAKKCHPPTWFILYCESIMLVMERHEVEDSK